MTDDSLWPHRSSIYHQTINRVDCWYNITLYYGIVWTAALSSLDLRGRGDFVVWCMETCEEFLLSFLIEWLTETCCPFHPTTTSIILILLIVKRLEDYDYQSGTGRWWLEGGQCCLKIFNYSWTCSHRVEEASKTISKMALNWSPYKSIVYLPTHTHFIACYPSHRYNRIDWHNGLWVLCIIRYVPNKPFYLSGQAPTNTNL